MIESSQNLILMRSLHLFCRVIDNYGDIGVCWRLARQIANEHHLQVTLWIDQLESFQRICAAIDCSLDTQQLDGVTVRRWGKRLPSIAAEQIPDLVIEGFGCRLPYGYLRAMAARTPKPVWINLEYLSAEDWVEGCHRLPSPHPSLPLTKHFFFPGFTSGTGGLLRESDLDVRRAKFEAGPDAASTFLAQLGVTPDDGQNARRVLTLFCYPDAPLSQLFAMLQHGERDTLCLVPEGVATDAVRQFIGRSARAGAGTTRGQLRLQVVPFLEQTDYDRLLWSADFNFVRGEDSLVRAHWAERPLCWHIYPQQQNAHRVKLDAFLERYCAGLPAPAARALADVMGGWNGDGIDADAWQRLWSDEVALLLRRHAHSWVETIRQHGDLAANLLRFAEESC